MQHHRLGRTRSELPMDLEKALLEEAQYAVSDLKNCARALEPQLEEIKKLKLEIEAECQAGRLAPKRLLQYEFKIGTEYQCPPLLDLPRAPVCASPRQLCKHRPSHHALPNLCRRFCHFRAVKLQCGGTGVR